MVTSDNTVTYTLDLGLIPEPLNKYYNNIQNLSHEMVVARIDRSTTFGGGKNS